ncbi:MAG: CheR family methyltransferase [Solirubrobacteraceae bacterium]
MSALPSRSVVEPAGHAPGGAAAASQSQLTVVPDDDYVVFCEGLRRLVGIDLAQYKRPQMERRLRAYFARREVESLAEGLERVRANAAELDSLLDRMTINVSQLWRHPEQWARLERDVLPELARTGQVRAWSAGCSYGAEAFTLAAICARAIPTTRVRILGTDIDRRMIERAKVAVFSPQDARGVAARDLEAGFEHVPEGWRAREALRRMTSFELSDLLRLRPRTASYDLILCRNTVIYFAEAIRDELHARLAQALRSGGYLVIGATERVSAPDDLQLEMAHPFIYRKA